MPTAPVPPPDPPYFAVVFSSVRRGDPPPEPAGEPEATDGQSYAEVAQRMLVLATEQPGFLGMDTARGADGLGISVSYWRDEASIAAWRGHAEHLHAQAEGRRRFYQRYVIHVARVERSYQFPGG